MQKTFTLFILLIIINLPTIHSQPWHYDFGTSTGSYTTNAISTVFLPTPPNGGTITRIGSGGGSINLENQMIIFGENSYLRGTASSSGSVNKFGVNNYTPGKSFTLTYTIRLGASNGSGTGPVNGVWYFFAGDGVMYADGGVFAGAQVFTGFRFRFGANDSLFFSFRNKGIWDSVTCPKTYFKKGQTYTIEIYGNNTTSSKTYDYWTTQSLDSGKWDLWVDGILFGNDLQKGLMLNDANIDSWVFYGESSTGNAANIFVDEFYYHNDIAGTPLPVTLSSFDIIGYGRSAVLNWITASEINNSGFIVERCAITSGTPTEWQKAAFITGNGTTTEPKSYSYIDNDLKSGSYKYRLKQVDYNGNFEYFTPANSEFITILKPTEFSLSQNYPNPSNPVTKIDYQLPFAGQVNITVFDITGKAVKELVNGFQTADYHTVTFDGTNMASGIYFYRITGSSENLQFSKTMKMILLK